MKKPRVITFDWDGTLMDSTGSIVACAQAALADLGIEAPPAEAIRSTIGLGMVETMQILSPSGSESEHRRIRERYRFHWLATFRHRNTPLPGAAEALAALSEAGFLLAVATGKGRTGLDWDLRESGWGDYFLATRTADEAPSKPHPQMLFDVMQELGVVPAENLMVGDTTYDMEMAANAGCPSVAVLTGSHEQHRLQAHGPLACLGSVGELPAWLASPPAKVAP